MGDAFGEKSRNIARMIRKNDIEAKIIDSPAMNVARDVRKAVRPRRASGRTRETIGSILGSPHSAGSTVLIGTFSTHVARFVADKTDCK